MEDIEAYISDVMEASESVIRQAYTWWDKPEEDGGINFAYRHFCIMSAYFREIIEKLNNLDKDN